MSVLVVGVSHHTAPVALLERLALPADGIEKLVHAVASADHVQEATVLATCNRIETYTEVDRFHGSVDAVCRALCELSGQPSADVVPHLYVHYDDGAVSHLFNVAAGLDSMVVGEGQILHQTREALRLGQELGTVGPALNAAFQQALRVAKRAHAETDIDRAAPSLVSVALARAEEHVGPLAGRRAVLVGAGAMAGLAAATLHRRGVRDLVVLNRTRDRATRLAEQYAGRAADLGDLPAEVATADVVVSCTGSIGQVLGAADVRRARQGRQGRQGDRTAPLAVVDLALPHDVDPEVATLPGVVLVDLRRLAEEADQLGAVGGADADGVAGVRRIVAEEVQAFLDARRLASVTPTVVALRTMATGVVEAELSRLEARLPDLDEQVRAELRQAVRRVADKLMHQPTVRVKELAGAEGAVSYAEALTDLFSLDQQAVEAVTRADAVRP
ncbi:MAG: Glutamyl-tRNA reductase [uncultured Nocardioidaceae bacterium]|uniref:Glutamyl-tRNA reductase n=1 Tax=uncultured Nocardioidaceae bacterium TaxID=253824 RepID=A0A6J4M471_9ACTN|nr:MAG: Glutamyl-tRNA reductase [uncultured Nocardioidaceae bacterium]